MNELIITAGCFEDECQKEEFFGGTIEEGRWKTFAMNPDQSIFCYDQLKVDPYACTIVSTYSALTDRMKDENGIITASVPYSVMIGTLERMKKDGKFRPGFGAKLADGVQYATEDFNAWRGSHITPVMIMMTYDNMVMAMKKGSSIVSGINVPSGYFVDENDNGVIDHVWQKGNIGHCIRYGVINTNGGDVLAKYGENYHGEVTKTGIPAKDVIFLDLETERDIMFNTGFYFA